MIIFKSSAFINSGDKDLKRPTSVFIAGPEEPVIFNLEQALKLKNEATELFAKFQEGKDKDKEMNLILALDMLGEATIVCPREE